MKDLVENEVAEGDGVKVWAPPPFSLCDTLSAFLFLPAFFSRDPCEF